MTQEQHIQLIDFTVPATARARQMDYKNMLAISNLDQLKYYHDIKQKRCENDYANVLTTHLGHAGRSDLHATNLPALC